MNVYSIVNVRWGFAPHLPTATLKAKNEPPFSKKIKKFFGQQKKPTELNQWAYIQYKNGQKIDIVTLEGKENKPKVSISDFMKDYLSNNSKNKNQLETKTGTGKTAKASVDFPTDKCIIKFEDCYSKEKALIEWIKANKIKILNSGIKIA